MHMLVGFIFKLPCTVGVFEFRYKKMFALVKIYFTDDIKNFYVYIYVKDRAISPIPHCMGND